MSSSRDASSSEHEEDVDAPEQEQEQSQEDPQPSSSKDPLQVKPRRINQPKAQIIAHLEHIVHTVATAMHAGNFDPASPPWTDHFHPSFHAEVGLLANSLSKKKVSLEDFLHFTSARREAHPEWRMNVASMSTNVNVRRGKADVFCNLELVGLPVGIVRPSVASLGFECYEGKWMFVRWTSFRGLGDGNELSVSSLFG